MKYAGPTHVFNLTILFVDKMESHAKAGIEKGIILQKYPASSMCHAYWNMDYVRRHFRFHNTRYKQLMLTLAFENGSKVNGET